MITVRFPNGQAVQYNDAGFVDRDQSYSDLYVDSTKEKWIAQVPNTCLIEIVQPCCVYNALPATPVPITIKNDPNNLILDELKAIKRRLNKLEKK